MVIAKLLSNENGKIRYSYQPENDGECGVLSYDTNHDISEIEKLAEKDIKSTFYRNHVFKMIRENINKLPEHRTLMWY